MSSADEHPVRTHEQIAEDFRKYEGLGVFDYVLPATKPGNGFVLGYKGQILKFSSDNDADHFLIGLNLMQHFIGTKPGIAP